MITKSKSQGWMTPRGLFAGLHARYSFTVDGAASLGNALLPRFWTAAHAGGRGALGMSWAGEVVWVNPPFGMIGEFLACALAWRASATCVMILPANVDTAWFHDLAVHADKHVFRGRVSYVPPPGVAASTPSFPSMLAITGPGVVASGLGFTEALHAKTGAYLDETPDPIRSETAA